MANTHNRDFFGSNCPDEPVFSNSKTEIALPLANVVEVDGFNNLPFSYVQEPGAKLAKAFLPMQAIPFLSRENTPLQRVL
jgi:hypothetical protein